MVAVLLVLVLLLLLLVNVVLGVAVVQWVSILVLVVDPLFSSSSGLSLRNIFFVGAFGGTTFPFSRWRSPFLTLLELL